MTSKLEVENVTFSFGAVQVLFGVSLAAERGESVALVGTNGAGKSTLLRVVAGLYRPSGGTVQLDGEDISGIPAEKLVTRGLVLVEGGRSVFPDLTVADNITIQALTMRRRPGWVDARLERVLDTFPALKRSLNRAAGSLSGGEQQQLALAKAMLLDPAVLCIDELSLGLAPIVVESLMNVVRSIHESGITIVLVEQNLNVAAQVCERVVFLEKGEVRFEGPVRDLIERDDLARAVFFR